MNQYRPLPAEALRLCRAAGATPRLEAHLTLVHDVASRLASAIRNAFPELNFDAALVLFGAATHDIGKAVHTHELVRPGKAHEAYGVELLRSLGVSPERVRFAFTHGNWDSSAALGFEDRLVALADNCWKGKRNSELEAAVVHEIAEMTGSAEWLVFASLDDVLQEIAAGSDERLAWQGQFSVND